MLVSGFGWFLSAVCMLAFEKGKLFFTMLARQPCAVQENVLQEVQPPLGGHGRQFSASMTIGLIIEFFQLNAREIDK